MDPSFLPAVEQAFRQANVNGDCKFTFQTQSVAIGAITVARCNVQYESGNEYIRIDKLLESIKAFSEISLVEYRGRGSNEEQTLVIELRIDGKHHQIIYSL